MSVPVKLDDYRLAEIWARASSGMYGYDVCSCHVYCADLLDLLRERKAWVEHDATVLTYILGLERKVKKLTAALAAAKKEKANG